MPFAAPFAAPVEEPGDAVRDRVVMEVGHAEEAFRDARYVAHEDAPADGLSPPAGGEEGGIGVSPENTK